MKEYIKVSARQHRILKEDNGHDVLDRLNDQPEWITDMKPLTDLRTINSIACHGCNSGAYVPPCIYQEAFKIMENHGDAVLAYLEEAMGHDLPVVPTGTCWKGMSSYYLRLAIEIWASQFDLISALEVEEE